MAYRDEMEAARQRVAVLERELSDLLPGGGEASLGVQMGELRRRLARAEEALESERRTRARGELAVQELAVARDRLRSLEESLEMVQGELQRRRREHEALWRQAALASVRGREADELRAALREAVASSEREARRADLAEVALIKTQMRLAVELARPRVEAPWSLDAPLEEREALAAALAPEALEAAAEADVERELTRLALLFGDTIWNATGDDHAELRVLLDLLRELGHALREHDRDRVRLGPRSADAPGLRVAMAPLALQLTWTSAAGRGLVVTIADDAPLSLATR